MGEDESIKMSCKGVNKKIIMNMNPYGIYDHVLRTGEAEGSTNQGFRVIKDRIFTYSCYRQAFPYFYIKRNVVSECGTYTEPYFNLVLNPIPKHYVCVYTDLPSLSMDDPREFQMDDLKFQTIRQAHCYKKYTSMFFKQSGSKKAKTANWKMKMFHIMKDILNTTDAFKIHQIEKQLVPQDHFYLEEFDTLYNILNIKIETYPEIVSDLLSVQKQLVVNTCGFNSRLGTGVPHRQVRWDKISYLYGGNKFGHVIMSTAILLNKTLSK